jgi:murein endopeptidase
MAGGGGANSPLGATYARNDRVVSDAPGGAGPSEFVDLPHNGSGYYSYGNPQARWGKSVTIRTVQEVAKEWNNLHPDKPIGVGNISLQRGGAFPPHKAHKTGLDIDIRPMRKDGEKTSIYWTSPQYDKELTQEVINLFNKQFHVRKIYFNDPRIRGVVQLKGHDNHIHIETR